jgi:hypothetical protein
VPLVAVAVAAVALTRIHGATPTSAMGPPHFGDETATSGLSHTYDGNFDYATGGGVAVFDCNGDGKPDSYLAGVSNPAALAVLVTLPGSGFASTSSSSPFGVHVSGTAPSPKLQRGTAKTPMKMAARPTRGSGAGAANRPSA